MIVGTAGHIDHGKTALVKALTGVDADRLKEEKARGITIDLGYAYSDLGDGRQLGFVDVPGHERFVHNMLAGATGIDAALLVVSAAEGIKPQTVEHLQIVDLLGLDRGIVALTKADLADDDQILERMAEVETLLATTSLKGAEIVPVSALTGQGVDELKAKLLALGESGKGATGFARLAIDRCFVLTGAGVVVTGTVHAGEIRVDDRLLLTPSGLEARVRSLHAQNRAAEVGRAGERCALNLTGPRLSKDAIRRGDWVVSPELHAPTDRPDVRLHLLASEGQPLKHWSPVHVHLGSAHVMGRVALLEGDRLAPGDTALAQLVLEDKIGALAGDRVILRDPSATRTMAGAAVIDPFGPPRNRRSERRLAELDALGEADADVLPKLLRLESGFVETGRFGQARNLRPVDVDRLLQMAGGAKLEGFGFLAETLAAARKDIVETLAAHHQVQARCARPAAGAAAGHAQEALAGAGVQGAARPGGAGQDGDGRRAVPAPARPFADPGRARRGAVEEDLGRARSASASSRRGCATSPAPIRCRSPRCASCCSGWPRSAGSSRWRPTSISCGPWWPR